MRLVFCNTTGRSGTGWLSFVLSRELKAVVEHEGSPKMVKLRSGKTPPTFCEIKKWWRDKKLPHIKKISRGLPYIDTGHLVNKGFLKPLMDLGVVPDLIILRRDPRSVAKSLLKLNTIPFRSKKGRKYCFNKYDKLHIPLPTYHKFSDYQLCYWYCLECQVRAVANKKKIAEAGGKICELNFNEILEEGYAATVINTYLGIPKKGMFEKYADSFRLFLSTEKEKSKNKKEAQKHDYKDSDVNYDQEELEVICNIKKIESDC